MPAVLLHPPCTPPVDASSPPNPLPPLLQTPAGLAIVEIQGSLHVPSTIPDAAGTHIGRLVFPLFDADADASDMKWMKKVYLYVGRHQRLTGEVKKLGKAVGVVRKVEGKGEELEIVDVVRWKVLFAGRPEPVDVGG